MEASLLSQSGAVEVLPDKLGQEVRSMMMDYLGATPTRDSSTATTRQQRGFSLEGQSTGGGARSRMSMDDFMHRPQHPSSSPPPAIGSSSLALSSAASKESTDRTTRGEKFHQEGRGARSSKGRRRDDPLLREESPGVPKSNDAGARASSTSPVILPSPSSYRAASIDSLDASLDIDLEARLSSRKGRRWQIFSLDLWGKAFPCRPPLRTTAGPVFLTLFSLMFDVLAQSHKNHQEQESRRHKD